MSSSSVEQIKERLGIVDVLSSYLKLEKAGANFKAVCPFHNEKTPSFFISPARNTYYCFGCGVKGDIFSFVQLFEGLDFKGALAALAQRAGVELTAYVASDKSEKDRLYELMDLATKFYESKLLKTAEAEEYVLGRGITKATTSDFRIGYAPADWRELTEAMRAKGFTDAELISAGLAKRPDGNARADLYDRFRDRIMFPIADPSGRVIAFSGRMLHDDGSGMQGKYINSPETLIFKKGSTLYGLDKAKFEIRKKDMAVLVEGQMDLVLSHQAGFAYTVASSGTALGDTLVSDVERGLLSGLGAVHALTKNLVIAFDGDKAGLRAAGRVERIALSLGMNVKVAKLPSGKDPADTIRESGADAWKKILDTAQHIILCYLSILMEHPLSEITRMRAIRDKILPYVAVMPSAIERAHFIKEIHLASGLPIAALEEDVARLISGVPTIKMAPAQSPSAPHRERVRGTQIRDRIIGILYWQESLDMPHIDLTALRKKLQTVFGPERYQEIMELSQGQRNERIFEVELLYDDPKKVQQETEELLDNLEAEVLGTRLEELLTELSIAEKEDNPARLKELLSESQTVTSRLNTIKSSRFIN